MRYIESKQKGIQFLQLKSPFTIDKREAWGDKAENNQQFPKGGYLKTSSPTEVSHGVQPNATWTAPEGWIPTSTPGLYDKLNIWIEDEVLQVGQEIKINTLDGPITYTAKEPSVVCFNGDSKAPNTNDGWLQTVRELTKNYHYEATAHA